MILILLLLKSVENEMSEDMFVDRKNVFKYRA